MRSLFNQSLLYCYLEQQKDQALTNQMRLDVSEKRALVNLVRGAIDKSELDRSIWHNSVSALPQHMLTQVEHDLVMRVGSPLGISSVMSWPA
jgi:hypothetical protein